MIRFISQKLKSQSLNEQEPDLDFKLDEDRDSGTESDDENVELELEDLELTRTKMDDRNQHDTSSYGSLSLPVIGDSYTQWADNHPEDNDRHISEEEHININNGVFSEGNENDPLISERGMVGLSSGRCICDSVGSSDEEVWKFMFQQQPVMFACSLPSDARRIYHSSIPHSPALFPKVISPLGIVSPWKRHRPASTADLFDENDADCHL